MTLIFATVALASPDPTGVDFDYFDSLPSPETATMHCTFSDVMCISSARVIVAEVREQQGRLADAVAWATAALQVQFQQIVGPSLC